jgi:hypothetical protein
VSAAACAEAFIGWQKHKPSARSGTASALRLYAADISTQIGEHACSVRLLWIWSVAQMPWFGWTFWVFVFLECL